MPVKIRVGFDTSLDNKGLDLEQCVTLLESLGWKYDLVRYVNRIGYVDANGSSGMLGDVQRGDLDMVCGRFRMTTERMDAISFSYPIHFEVNQVYLIADPKLADDVGFLFRPFSATLWLFLVATFFLAFFALRTFDFARKPLMTLSHLISFTINVDFGRRSRPTSLAFHLFSMVWLLSWWHVFVDYYTSELSGMLVVSGKKNLPFQNFHGLIDSLRTGKYRLLTTSRDRLPECPPDVSTEVCRRLLADILSKFPPKIGDLTLLSDVVGSGVLEMGSTSCTSGVQPPLVGFAWYPSQRVSSPIAIWTEQSFHSNIWSIRDFTVSPVAYPVRKNFTLINQLNAAIVAMLSAFATIDNRYTPSYPPFSLSEAPATSPFSIAKLGSVFVVHIGFCIVASLVLILEIPTAKRRNRKTQSFP